MKKILAPIAIVSLVLFAMCGKSGNTSHIEMTVSGASDGDTISLVSYLDSVPVAQAVALSHVATVDIDVPETLTPMQVMFDGRVMGFLIPEAGTVVFNDSLPIATGTPANETFAREYAALDSVDNLDDIKLYAAYAGEAYNRHRNCPVGDYLAMEWLRFAPADKLDSITSALPDRLTNSRRGQKHIKSAKLRQQTAPGSMYIDFSANDADGKLLKLSDLVAPGKYTLVDFWASWCPYCVKELPQLIDLYSRYKEKGFEIVGVAVRDRHEDTAEAVKRHNIPWRVMYDAERRPYDIYGFAGIPAHILIGPDGKIISRDENAEQLGQRLAATLK